MSYIPLGWSGSDLISARRLRYMETQYDEAMDALSEHDHDDRYYLQTQADAKYFHIDDDEIVPAASFDADTLQGVHALSIIGIAMPTGAILAWSGTDANIPTGWRICNGGGGTVDLRNRFVVGAGGAYAVGNTGGQLTVTPGAGTVTIAGHAINSNQLPRHRHVYYDYYGFGNADDYGGKGGSVSHATNSYTSRSANTSNAGGDEEHGHAGSSVSITSADLENRPPYYALYYIQKVG
ncbi:MAG: hypothetical protein WBK88_03350 [Methanothrix sp.]